MVRHVIWDWNGTLLDDFDAVLSAMSAACESAGGPVITAEIYRRSFSRPIDVAYERLLGRPLAEGEWARLTDLFHTFYERCFRSASLAPDAEEALESVARAGITQSLLSMWEHETLLPAVEYYGVSRYFVRIDGQPTRGGGRKREHLERHLEHLERALAGPVPPAEILLVGDSLDDAHAADALGIPCVLLDSGPHLLEALQASGVPLAGSLLEALRIGGALSPASTASEAAAEERWSAPGGVGPVR